MSDLFATRIDVASCSPLVQRICEGIHELWLYSLPLTVRFRGVSHREGFLMRGEEAWGECSPFTEYEPPEASRWLMAALSAALTPAPTAKRDTVTVNVTIPVESPEAAAQRVRNSAGCATAKVKVADPRSTLAEDCARIEAVTDALRDTVGYRARVRVDANGAWDVDQAQQAIRELNRAASCIGGLEYVEQPCPSVEELATLRRRVDTPIAADESIRRAEDPLRVAALDAADIAVIKVAPLGGTERALDIAKDTGLDVVVSSALETSVGIAMGVAAGAALDEAPFASGLATVQLLAADVTSAPALPQGGVLPVRPILPDLLEQALNPVTQNRVDFWMNRLEAMATYCQ